LQQGRDGEKKLGRVTATGWESSLDEKDIERRGCGGVGFLFDGSGSPNIIL